MAAAEGPPSPSADPVAPVAAIPAFAYHPDPVGTGAVESQPGRCRCCGEVRGWVHVLGAYGPDDLRDAVCPWCIADGSAAERFGVTFNDLGATPTPAGVPPHVLSEIERRTPGFSAWQGERWLFCCDDGAAFLGAVGWEELEHHPDAAAMVREEVAGWGWDAEGVEIFLGSLDVDGASTAYLFRCRHCGTHLAYADYE